MSSSSDEELSSGSGSDDNHSSDASDLSSTADSSDNEDHSDLDSDSDAGSEEDDEVECSESGSSSEEIGSEASDSDDEDDDDEEGSSDEEEEEDGSTDASGSTASGSAVDSSDDEESESGHDSSDMPDSESESSTKQNQAKKDKQKADKKKKKRKRRKPRLTAAQLLEIKTTRKALKHVKKHVFKIESAYDPAFFSYLTLMHSWHELTLVDQRRQIAEEKSLEMEKSVYDPVDGIADGMKSIWAAIQAEVDALPIERRLSSPLKFRRVAEMAMDMEHTGRMRRMIVMERSILHVVLYILRACNGKIAAANQRPPSVIGLRSPSLNQSSGDEMGSPQPLPMPGSLSHALDEIEEEDANMEDEAGGAAAAGGAAKRNNNKNAAASRRRTNRSRTGAVDEEKHGGANLMLPPSASSSSAAAAAASSLEAPLRTRSSLRRVGTKAARPTTFTNIPSIRRTRSDDEAAAAAVLASRSASAPPHEPVANNNNSSAATLVTPPASSKRGGGGGAGGRGKKRRAPDSNSSEKTTVTTRTADTARTRTLSSPAMAQALAAAGSVPLRAAVNLLPVSQSLRRFSSQPPLAAAAGGADLCVEGFSGMSPAMASAIGSSCPPSPLALGLVGGPHSSPHRNWLVGVIKHRDDLHLFLASVLFMSFVHVTDSEKLSAFKKQTLTALLHHAGWGKQRIQAQMHRMLRVPTVSSGTTSGAAMFSSMTSPITPSSALANTSRRHTMSHTLHPNASMIYQFDSLCLNLIERDLLPALRDRVPGSEEQYTEEEQARDEAARAREDEEQDDAAESKEDLLFDGEEDNGAESSAGDEESDASARSRIRRGAPRVKRLPRRSQHSKGKDKSAGKTKSGKKAGRSGGKGGSKAKANLSRRLRSSGAADETDDQGTGASAAADTSMHQTPSASSNSPSMPKTLTSRLPHSLNLDAMPLTKPRAKFRSPAAAPTTVGATHAPSAAVSSSSASSAAAAAVSRHASQHRGSPAATVGSSTIPASALPASSPHRSGSVTPMQITPSSAASPSNGTTGAGASFTPTVLASPRWTAAVAWVSGLFQPASSSAAAASTQAASSSSAAAAAPASSALEEPTAKRQRRQASPARGASASSGPHLRGAGTGRPPPGPISAPPQSSPTLRSSASFSFDHPAPVAAAAAAAPSSRSTRHRPAAAAASSSSSSASPMDVVSPPAPMPSRASSSRPAQITAPAPGRASRSHAAANSNSNAAAPPPPSSSAHMPPPTTRRSGRSTK